MMRWFRFSLVTVNFMMSQWFNLSSFNQVLHSDIVSGVCCHHQVCDGYCCCSRFVKSTFPKQSFLIVPGCFPREEKSFLLTRKVPSAMNHGLIQTDMVQFSRIYEHRNPVISSSFRIEFSRYVNILSLENLKSQDDEMVSLLIGYCEYYNVTIILFVII